MLFRSMQEAHMQAKQTVYQAQEEAKKKYEATLIETRASLEEEFKIHVEKLASEKDNLLYQILQEKKFLLPLLEQTLIPTGLFKNEGAIVN